MNTHQSDPANRARLRWRARRGLLENDLILTRFLDAHEETMTDEEVDALTRLLDLADNPLMDLLLGRAEPEGELAVDLAADAIAVGDDAAHAPSAERISLRAQAGNALVQGGTCHG